MDSQATLNIKKGLALAIVRSRREADSTIKRLKEQVATLDRELEQYRLRKRNNVEASEVGKSPVSPGAAEAVPLASSTPARTVNIAAMRAAGAPVLQHQLDADVTHQGHLAELLRSLAAETAALERSGLQEEDIRFVAEVRAMQLAGLTVDSNRAADLAQQAPHSDDASSHGLIPCSRAPQAAVGERARSYQQHADAPHGSVHSSAIRESAALRALGGQASEQRFHSGLESACEAVSLASALTAGVDFLLHGVLSMQPGLLQSSFAASALSFITAVQAAWPGEPSALVPILDRLSSGLIAEAAQGNESCSGLAAEFLQEFLEAPQTGQAVFGMAAKELKKALDAPSINAREEEASDYGQMQKVEALCDVLDAALLKLPDWLSQPVVAFSSAPSQESLSQAMECVLQAHSTCEACHRQAAPGTADRLKALAVQLIMRLQHYRG